MSATRMQAAPAGSTPNAPFALAVQQQAATLLVRLYDYLQTNAEPHPVLMNAVPTAFEAVDMYGKGLYPQALAQTMLIYQWIDNQRGSLPSLPIGQ
jgi:hypothetical protein